MGAYSIGQPGTLRSRTSAHCAAPLPRVASHEVIDHAVPTMPRSNMSTQGSMTPQPRLTHSSSHGGPHSNGRSKSLSGSSPSRCGGRRPGGACTICQRSRSSSNSGSATLQLPLPQAPLRLRDELHHRIDLLHRLHVGPYPRRPWRSPFRQQPLGVHRRPRRTCSARSTPLVIDRIPHMRCTLSTRAGSHLLIAHHRVRHLAIPPLLSPRRASLAQHLPQERDLHFFSLGVVARRRQEGLRSPAPPPPYLRRGCASS